MLCHGRECYRKNGILINYNFYKNVVYLFPQFWWGIYSGFSASTYFDVTLFQCFNAMYTALPIIIYASFDKEYKNKVLLGNPKNYQIGQEEKYMNYKVLHIWLLEGVVHTAIITFFITYATNTFQEMGMVTDTTELGQMTFLLLVSVCNYKVLCLHNQQFGLSIVINILSTLCYVLMLYLFGLSDSQFLFNILYRIFHTPYFLFSIFLCIGGCNFIDIAILKFRKFYDELEI